MIQQLPNLTYTTIENLYYITNPIRREVIVLNKTAFLILQTAHEITIEDLCDVISVKNDDVTFQNISREDILSYLESLKNLELIEY